MADQFPFGVYDSKQCRLAHIGLYENEAKCWEVYLGWPVQSEIDQAKRQGLKVLPLTITYDLVTKFEPGMDAHIEDYGQ